MEAKHLTESWKEQLELYALGTLKPEGSGKIEKHLQTGCAACHQEVKEIQTALTALPEGLPGQRLPTFSKNRILGKIHLSITADSVGFDTRHPNFEQIRWEELGMDGVRVHWLRKDNESGTTVALLRVQPGYTFTNHRHVGAEDCFVLQGGFEDERGTYEAGQYIHYEAGSIQHGLRALDGEDCILFLVNEGGIELLAEDSF